MSFSDDEDFNDIYGDDSNATSTTAATTAAEPTKQEVAASAANAQSADTSKPQGAGAAASASTEAAQPAAVAQPAPAPAASSSLDQLAALQALSSNLSQLQQAASGNNNSSTESQTKDSSSTSDTAAVPATSTASAPPAMPGMPAMPSMPGMPSMTGMPGMPGMPNMQQWQQLQQLQQSMPQFQQGGASGPGSAAEQRTNKADLSRDICKMFIGGLNWETTEDNLKDYFSKYGQVTDLKIMRDNATGRSRGFGFLTFAEASSVDEVVKTQHILDGKVIDPKRAIPREEQDKTGKIFVGGIGPDVRPKEFEEFFSQWGTIIDAQLMLDKDTGRSRGFGFITYDTPDAVDRVCENKFIEFKGKRIEIKRAEPRHLQKQQQQQKHRRLLAPRSSICSRIQ